ETYKKESVMIPYGANINKINSEDILKEFDLKPGNYILYVSRLEPENNAHIVIESFKKVNTEKKLVIVGDAPYASKYKHKLKKLAESDKRIIFTGFVFGKGYKEFQSHAFCYIHATEIGGTHPALIEAMGFGNCVIANGTPENIEVVGNAGIIYRKNDVDDLRNKLEYLVKNPDIIESYRKKAQERVKQHYSWDIVVDKYENLFKILTNK
ncbi:MAG: glycosyltransferase, partial [Candidatus Aminicenantes bacterium]|nr:glycosyltransferase [Candidatus Aminicenantes bacterium]